MLDVTDWCGLGRNISELASEISRDTGVFLQEIFSYPIRMAEVLSYGTVSIRGSCLDTFANTGFIPSRNSEVYLFIPLNSTVNPKVIKAVNLTLRGEGYTSRLRNQAMNAWPHFRQINVCKEGIALTVPFFYTQQGTRINVIVYDDSESIEVWNAIPGICLYSPGLTALSAKDLRIASEMRVIRLYEFCSFPSRDENLQIPSNFLEVDGQSLCIALGCNPFLTETSFTLLTNSYLSAAMEFQDLIR